MNIRQREGNRGRERQRERTGEGEYTGTGTEWMGAHRKSLIYCVFPLLSKLGFCR